MTRKKKRKKEKKILREKKNLTLYLPPFPLKFHYFIMAGTLKLSPLNTFFETFYFVLGYS